MKIFGQILLIILNYKIKIITERYLSIKEK